MSALFAPPRYSPMSGNGTSYPAAKLYFYITGTTTPSTVTGGVIALHGGDADSLTVSSSNAAA